MLLSRCDRSAAHVPKDRLACGQHCQRYQEQSDEGLSNVAVTPDGQRSDAGHNNENFAENRVSDPGDSIWLSSDQIIEVNLSADAQHPHDSILRNAWRALSPRHTQKLSERCRRASADNLVDEASSRLKMPDSPPMPCQGR